MARTLGDESAEQERREVLEITAVNAVEIPLKAVQEMAVVPDRRVAQAAFLPQIGEEAGSLPGERMGASGRRFTAA